MTKSTRCKFVCTSVDTRDTADGSANSRVRLEARYDENAEADSSFAKFTPAGSLEIHVTNPAVAPMFEAGKAYYVDVTAIEAAG